MWPEVEGPGDHPKADPAECRGARGELEIEEREASDFRKTYGEVNMSWSSALNDHRKIYRKSGTVLRGGRRTGPRRQVRADCGACIDQIRRV